MKNLVAVLCLLSVFGVRAGDVLCQARVWASAKTNKMRFTLTPTAGRTDWKAPETGYLQDGDYETWNDVAYTLAAKDDGRYYFGFDAPHAPENRKPEIAWADIRVEGATLKNLDFAKGLAEWGVSTKEAPRIVEVDGRNGMPSQACRNALTFGIMRGVGEWSVENLKLLA